MEDRREDKSAAIAASLLGSEGYSATVEASFLEEENRQNSAAVEASLLEEEKRQAENENAERLVAEYV